MSKIRRRYHELLEKYSNDEDLIELMDSCVVDESIKRDFHYETTGKHLEKRCLLSKLRTELYKRSEEYKEIVGREVNRGR